MDSGGQLFRREFEPLRPVHPTGRERHDERDARCHCEADCRRPPQPPAHIERARRENERQRDLVSQQSQQRAAARDDQPPRRSTRKML